ncbi:FlxA-like family protein [Pantoea ananatis]|uniref:FlxA-like family protein n=1 Tax=Pantoea ananas TaxID=553 RepID=UPI001EE5D747|nr:FlxA-like family protein [Pantoea ananatis]PKC45529.1 protein flxA [Pantoea ananatis BRT98]
MSISIQTTTNTGIGASDNSGQDVSSQIAQIAKQIQKLTEKLGKISSEEGVTPEQKKEMARMIQKQIQSLAAEMAQLQRKQAEKAEKKDRDYLAQSENKVADSSANLIDIYV